MTKNIHGVISRITSGVCRFSCKKYNIFSLLYFIFTLCDRNLRYNANEMGFYKENFTKKYEKLSVENCLTISELHVSCLYTEYWLEECQIYTEGKKRYILGLVEAECFERMSKMAGDIIENVHGINFGDTSLFLVYYKLKEKEVYQDVFDLVKATASFNKIDLQRSSYVDYKKWIKIGMVDTRARFIADFLEKKDRIRIPPDYQQLKNLNKDIFNSFPDDKFAEMVELLKNLCKNQYNESKLNTFIDWMESFQYVNSIKVYPSENIKYHKYFQLITNYYLLTLDKRLIFSMDYFLPEEIDDGPVHIYKSLVLSFVDDLENVKLVCYDREKNILETNQTYRILNKNIVIFYRNIKDPNIAFLKVKFGNKETDFVDVRKYVTKAFKENISMED